MSKYIFVLVFLGLPFATQAADDVLTIPTRVQAGEVVLYEGEQYLYSTGCTVTDDTGTEHVITGAKAICVLVQLEASGVLDVTFGYYAGLGLYLYTVDDYANDAVSYAEYWTYFVNYEAPSVGVDQYELSTTDELLLNFGPYTETALWLRTADSEVLRGQKIVVRVQDHFRVVPDAIVTFDDTLVATDSFGKASYRPDKADTTVTIMASKTGAVQSASKTITVVAKHNSTKPVSDATVSRMAELGVDFLKDTIAVDGFIFGSQSLSDWAAMALAAHGESAQRLNTMVVDYTPTVADGTTELARHILALVAIGQDPTNSSGVDYVARLKKTKSGKQFGSTAFVNDDIFAGLALLAAGEAGSAKDVALALRASKQGINSDGGVSYAVASQTSDVDTTAFFIQFLQAAEHAGSTVPSVAARQAARQFIAAQQNLDGGYAYSDDQVSNSATTAVVVQAWHSLKRDPQTSTRNKRDGYNYLQSIQHDDGLFGYTASVSSNYDVLNTAYVIIGLNGQALPVTP